MPLSHIMSCDRCGVQWRWLQMRTDEALPACPNPQCGETRVTQELAAPGINRGAVQQTSFEIPQTRAGREKFAYQMAEGMGFTNMKDNLREGEIAAPPAPEPVVRAPNGREMKVPFGYVPSGNTPDQVASSIATLVGGAGGPRVNSPAMRVLGGMKGR